MISSLYYFPHKIPQFFTEDRDFDELPSRHSTFYRDHVKLTGLRIQLIKQGYQIGNAAEHAPWLPEIHGRQYKELMETERP